MSESEAGDFALDPRDQQDAAAAAFDRMARRMAGLTAAVDGVAARQEANKGRDYGPELQTIGEKQDKFRTAILTLNERPGLQLTVEGIADSIERAGSRVRIADHQALDRAQQSLDASTRRLEKMIVGLIDLHKQAKWLAAAVGTVLVVGIITGDALPPIIDRAAPTSWRWPEVRAAGDLGLSMNDSGQRLLQVSDPARWHGLVQADRLMQANAATIAACRAHHPDPRRPVVCSLILTE